MPQLSPSRYHNYHPYMLRQNDMPFTPATNKPKEAVYQSYTEVNPKSKLNQKKAKAQEIKLKFHNSRHEWNYTTNPRQPKQQKQVGRNQTQKVSMKSIDMQTAANKEQNGIFSSIEIAQS